MVWVLFIVIASPGVFSGQWGTPTEVGEYQSIEECKAATKGAVYRFRDADTWKSFDDGAICIPRPARIRQ